MLTILAKILKILNSEASPWQVGWAIGFGVLAGLLPFGLLTLIVLLIVCLFTINLSTFLLVWGGSSTIMLVLGDPLEEQAWQYAQHPGLLRMLSGSEVLQLLHLHHTLVLGAFVVGLLILLPLAFAGAYLVKVYRRYLLARVRQLKIVQALKASKFVQLYQKLN